MRLQIACITAFVVVLGTIGLARVSIWNLRPVSLGLTIGQATQTHPGEIVVEWQGMPDGSVGVLRIEPAEAPIASAPIDEPAGPINLRGQTYAWKMGSDGRVALKLKREAPASAVEKSNYRVTAMVTPKLEALIVADTSVKGGVGRRTREVRASDLRPHVQALGRYGESDLLAEPTGVDDLGVPVDGECKLSVQLEDVVAWVTDRWARDK